MILPHQNGETYLRVIHWAKSLKLNRTTILGMHMLGYWHLSHQMITSCFSRLAMASFTTTICILPVEYGTSVFLSGVSQCLSSLKLSLDLETRMDAHIPAHFQVIHSCCLLCSKKQSATIVGIGMRPAYAAALLMLLHSKYSLTLFL